MASNLTAREQQVLIAVVKVAAIDSKAIDWTKVAAEADFNTAKQARDKFATVRAKLLAACPTANGEAAEGRKRKKCGPGAATTAAVGLGGSHAGRVGKKRKNEIESEGDDGDDPENVHQEMPKKKARVGGKAGKKKGAVTPDPQLDGDEEGLDLRQSIKKGNAEEEDDREGEWAEV